MLYMYVCMYAEGFILIALLKKNSIPGGRFPVAARVASLGGLHTRWAT